MYYSLGKDLVFVILALISSLCLLSQQELLATIFFILAIGYILFEHNISAYIQNA
jgi:hypothetical protein